MPARLDHLVVVARSLEAGAAFVEAALGVAPGPGRKHPQMGTHNLLLALGPDVYLEVAAIDPDVEAPARPRWFGLDELAADAPPRLAAWVASVDDIAAVDAPDLGAIATMEREGRTWQMTLTADGRPPLDGAGPGLIQRSTKVHPASVLPASRLQLKALRIEHPAPATVSRLLVRIGLVSAPRVTVGFAARCTLCAEIETPAGTRYLE